MPVAFQPLDGPFDESVHVPVPAVAAGIGLQLAPRTSLGQRLFGRLRVAHLDEIPRRVQDEHGKALKLPAQPHLAKGEFQALATPVNRV